MAAHDGGAAWRRKQRRLRSWRRHEQQSIAAVLATVSHHSYPKVDTTNAALRGQMIGTSTRAPAAAEYFELSSDDGRPAGGMRPKSLLEPRPQGRVVQHAGIGYELVLALDAPVLQMVEEVRNCGFLHASLVLQEHRIVQEIPAPSSVGRVSQPMDVEQVLNVPVLHMNHEDYTLSKFLGQLTLQEIPEAQVPVYPVEQRLVAHTVDIPVPLAKEQVIVQSVPEVQVPMNRVQQRHVEHIMDSPRLVGSSSTGSATAWLDAPQGHFQWFFFALSPGPKKVRTLGGSRLRESSRSPAHPRRQPMTEPPGLMTTMMLGRWWMRRTACSG